MIIYHVFTILHFGEIIDLPFGKPTRPMQLLELIGWFARVSFVLILGICAAISLTRRQKHPFGNQFLHFSKRGLKIITGGLLISISSLFLIPEFPIFFGILHFLGLTIILLPLLAKNRIIAAFSLIIFTSIYFWKTGLNQDQITEISNLLGQQLSIILGFSSNLRTADYFALLNWLPLAILGANIGYLIAQNPPKTPKLHSKAKEFLLKIGQHTFLLYFMHIIILLAATGLLKILLNKWFYNNFTPWQEI